MWQTRLFPAVALLALAACSDPIDPVVEAPPQIEAGLQAPLEQGFNHPDVANLAATVSGFGGLYLDGGVPTVYLTDVQQRAEVDAALAKYGDVRVRQGDYTYQQLAGWFNSVSPEALALPGVVFVDLDEARNRVFVGVEDGTAAHAVRGAVARLGLPGRAVVIEEVAPIRPAVRLGSSHVTLASRVRPIVGGLAIVTDGWVQCTLGFSAIHAVVRGRPSMITNSHCTNDPGGTEGTRFHQNYRVLHTSDRDYWTESFIAREAADPPFATIDRCPWYATCRRSDAARATYASAVTYRSAIARTIRPDNGSLDILGEFPITGEERDANLVGVVVNKMGSVTGWTRGEISRTCIDMPYPHPTDPDGDYVMLCQTMVRADAEDGDSGAPVFRTWGYSSWFPWGSSATLLGILWGASAWGGLFVYSPISNIEYELGPLRTTF